MRSWELFARYVVPELNGYTKNQRGSADFIHDNKEQLIRGAGAAIMAKIQADPRAAAALQVTLQQAKEQQSNEQWRPNAPDLESLAAEDSANKSPTPKS
jgi:limonene 1,2-monooxygenase